VNNEIVRGVFEFLRVRFPDVDFELVDTDFMYGRVITWSGPSMTQLGFIGFSGDEEDGGLIFIGPTDEGIGVELADPDFLERVADTVGLWYEPLEPDVETDNLIDYDDTEGDVDYGEYWNE